MGADLKILYCSENYSPHDFRFLDALNYSEHVIFWIRLEESGRVQEKRPLPKNIHPVKWRSSDRPTTWNDYYGLQRQFHKAVSHIKPDVIHAGPIQRVAILPVLSAQKPLISMSWGFDILEDANRNLFWKKITHHVLKNTDWLLTDCQTVKSRAVSYGASKECITVFPWGVDLDLFKPIKSKKALRDAAGFDGEVVFIHTRSWESRYGFDVALKGFALAARETKNIHLMMLGGGSQEAWIKDFVNENMLHDQIQFIGYQQNETLADYYRMGDVYLSASHIDGSSVALLESMACGCPALVSDISSNKEWVTNEIQGWVFKDGDANDLAQKIIHIAQSKEARVEVGRKAREKAEKDADWQKHISTLLSVYEHVANRF